MDRARAETVLGDIVLRNARRKVAAVSGDHRLVADLGFDSLSFLTLLADLEDAFEVPFPVEEIDDLQGLTVGELAAKIRRKLGVTPGVP